MRKIILLYIFSLCTATLYSQNQNLFITGLNITQINESQIKANLKVYSPDLATYNTYKVETSGNLITLKVCYNMYFSPEITNIDNDFYVTIPPDPGTYILMVKTYRANPGICSFIDNGYFQDSATLEFINPFEGTISLSTSDTGNNDRNIKLYPNPVEDILNFSDEVSMVKITDATGRIVKQYVSSQKSIDVSSLTKGIYTVTAATKSNGLINKKIIKK